MGQTLSAGQREVSRALGGHWSSWGERGALAKTQRTGPAENTDMQAFYMKTGSVDYKTCPLTSAR